MKKILFIFSITFCATIICGCGNEIDDTAYVIAIGVDKSGETYEFTLAIGNPAGINGGSGDRETLIFESQQGHDLFSAGEYVSAHLGQTVNFSHAELIVFSSDINSDGTAEILQSLTQHLNRRPQIMVATSSKSAGEAVRAINDELESNPEKYIKKILEDLRSPVSTGTSGKDLLCRTKNNSIGTALPNLENIDGITQVTSFSVLTSNETAVTFNDFIAYKMLFGDVKNLSFPTNYGTLILNQHTSPKIKALCGNKLEIFVNLTLSGTPAHIQADASKNALYKTTENEIAERVNALLNFSSKTAKIDFLNIESAGKKCFLTRRQWEAYGWKEKYKTATFNVTVKILPEKIGLLSVRREDK